MWHPVLSWKDEDDLDVCVCVGELPPFTFGSRKTSFVVPEGNSPIPFLFFFFLPIENAGFWRALSALVLRDPFLKASDLIATLILIFSDLPHLTKLIKQHT